VVSLASSMGERGSGKLYQNSRSFIVEQTRMFVTSSSSAERWVVQKLRNSFMVRNFPFIFVLILMGSGGSKLHGRWSLCTSKRAAADMVYGVLDTYVGMWFSGVDKDTT
jgi:antirestriction protein